MYLQILTLDRMELHSDSSIRCTSTLRMKLLSMQLVHWHSDLVNALSHLQMMFIFKSRAHLFFVLFM
ncbi:hypothetical protein LINPERPRIM_LOCUS8942 [Linum perenne]